MSTKTIQGKLWNVAPQFWAKHFEPWFLPMYKKALDQLQLSEDQLVLDAGCGSGFFSSMVINTGAQLIGVDAASGLLDVARQRNPRNNFMEEDLESLPFASNSFTVVVGFNSFQYAGSFESALMEARRVLAPGGRLVLGIWDKPEMSDASNVLKAIGTLLPEPFAGMPGTFALSEDGRMESNLEKNRLKLIHKSRVACPFQYSSLADAVKGFMGTGPAAAAMNYNAKKTVEQTIAKALKPYELADGFHFLQNHFLLFIAEK